MILTVVLEKIECQAVPNDLLELNLIIVVIDNASILILTQVYDNSMILVENKPLKSEIPLQRLPRTKAWNLAVPPVIH